MLIKNITGMGCLVRYPSSSFQPAATFMTSLSSDVTFLQTIHSAEAVQRRSEQCHLSAAPSESGTFSFIHAHIAGFLSLSETQMIVTNLI